MNFYTCRVIFVLLAMLKHTLLQHKVEKCGNFGARSWLVFVDRPHIASLHQPDLVQMFLLAVFSDEK